MLPSVSRIAEWGARVRQRAPLVMCITNHVTSNFIANALLAIGAIPAMVDAEEEVEEFVRLKADVLSINPGTVTVQQRQAMLKAVSAAKLNKLPWVLDPVAVGQLAYRTELIGELLRVYSPCVIRGNPSEINGLAKHLGGNSSEQGGGRGPNSAHSGEEALFSAQELTKITKSIVVMSGPEDYILDTNSINLCISNGSPIMGRVTGMGCVQSAVIAAFVGSHQHASGDREKHKQAVAAAVAHCAIAGEVAAEKIQKEGKGPGSFVAAYLDNLADSGMVVKYNGLAVSTF